ncbi:hypothetical protein IWZ03DRAFT_5819 [Phyllosticta citriasiana]|uniref:Transmembrane protein n=1 Tax=Phyllosticta citriasiana TaxID=595635 RepID=A0ABR1KZC3_9PEZI
MRTLLFRWIVIALNESRGPGQRCNVVLSLFCFLGQWRIVYFSILVHRVFVLRFWLSIQWEAMEGRQAGEARVVHRTRASGKAFGKRKREEATEKWAVGSDAQWFCVRDVFSPPLIFLFFAFHTLRIIISFSIFIFLDSVFHDFFRRGGDLATPFPPLSLSLSLFKKSRQTGRWAE